MALPGEAMSQVTLRLHTQLPKNLRVPDQPLAVPARLTRYGLSEVVNSLLRLGASLSSASSRAHSPHCPRTRTHAVLLSSETPVPFDFLLNDELLQTSLHTHLVQRGISAVRPTFRAPLGRRPAAAAP